MPPATPRASSSRRAFLGAIAATLLAGRATASQAFEPQELANYRLTDAVFRRVAHATRLLAPVLDAERFVSDPLITREIIVDGDAVEMATQLRTRLDADPQLAAALFAADISARDYARFAIVLFGARLAHGFLRSGAMRRVPAGVAADNVAFVESHAREIGALMKQLGLN